MKIEIGEVITFKPGQHQLYNSKGVEDESSIDWKDRVHTIKDVNGEYFQIQGDTTIWYKISSIQGYEENYEIY